MDNNQNQNFNQVTNAIPQGATKFCKHCKSVIPKDAKICPNCKKKQSGILKWIIIAVVIIAIIGIALGSGSQDSDSESKNNKTTANESNKNENDSEQNTKKEDDKKDSYGIGEVAENKDVQVTLTNITESNGSEYNTPSDGNVFVLAEFEITNNSNDELAISSALSFDAYQDGYSTSLSISALMEKTGEQLDGSIAPGKKMKGIVGYEVPADYKKFEINVQLDVWSSDKLVFTYEK